jgi:hypothetical protein
VSGGDRDALISRNTGGMSFDFSSTDSRIYLAGGCRHACCCMHTSRLLLSCAGVPGPEYDRMQLCPHAVAC